MKSKSSFVKVLVITSCHGEKKYVPDNIAISKDLDDLGSRSIKEEELKNYKVKAKEMFISNQNKMIAEALNYYDTSKALIDVSFVSSGYGYINSDDYVIPYDLNFSAMSMIELDKRSSFLKIHEELYYSAKNYDLVFFMLNNEYLRVIKLPIELPKNVKQIFFISNSDEKFLSLEEDIFLVKTGNEEAAKFNITPSELKSHIFKLICQASKNENVFAEIYNDQSYINSIIKKELSTNNVKIDQLNMFDL